MGPDNHLAKPCGNDGNPADAFPFACRILKQVPSFTLEVDVVPYGGMCPLSGDMAYGDRTSGDTRSCYEEAKKKIDMPVLPRWLSLG